MPNIAVITDTDSSLPPQVATEHHIHQIPIGIHFNETSYTSGVDIDDRLLFEKVDRLNCLPTTSAPNPGDFTHAFKSAFARGAEAIVCVCVSSRVSSTYTSAMLAREHFPGEHIQVIDSLNLSMAQGFMALAAAEAAAKNAGMDEIVSRVQEVQKKTHTFAMLSTLKYLALSGRASKFVTGLADTLNIKPILTVQDGKLNLLEKIRTRKRAMERVLALMETAAGSQGLSRLAIIHVNDPQGAAEMETALRATVRCPEEIIIAELTPGLSTHTGSGLVGVVVQTN